jgi:hypothetical protein
MYYTNHGLRGKKAIEEKPSDEGGNRTPPAGYPKDKDQYADPANYKYPIDDAEHVRAALTYFNRAGQREAGHYTDAEWAEMGKRIASAANAKIGEGHSYENGNVMNKKEVKTMEPEDINKKPANGQPQPGTPKEGGVTPPLEDKGKAMDGCTCPKCGNVFKCAMSARKDLPDNVIQALVALHDSIVDILPNVEELSGQGENAQEQTGPGEQGEKQPSAPSQPGTGQGMAPENRPVKAEKEPGGVEERGEGPDTDGKKSVKATSPDAIKAMFDGMLKDVKESVK